MLPQTNQRPEGQSQRFYELDSLRGVAALTVVLHHFSRICPDNVIHLLIRTPLRVLVAGHQAVILFFFLSGFVLTLPYQKRNRLNYGPFLLKRICRIYLPYLAALAFAVLCDRYLPPLASGNYWINFTWSEPVTSHLVIQHILFLGNYDWAQFNTAFWSLVYEMRISLVFPFIALAVLRLRSVWLIVLAVALSAITFPLVDLFSNVWHLCTPDAALNSMLTLHYAAFFIIGSLLAKHLSAINRWYSRLSVVQITAIALVSFGLYCFGDASSLFQRFSIPQDLFDWLVAVGAVMAIIFAINNRIFHGFLTSRSIHYLGERSFSLYLIHGTILFTLIHTLMGRLRLDLLLPLYLTATLLVTEIFYRLIERPTMLLGRRLTSPAKPRLPQTLQPAASDSNQ
jgi:peptidoglycan/LPS O-acetylase OafA/YrhL